MTILNHTWLHAWLHHPWLHSWLHARLHTWLHTRLHTRLHTWLLHALHAGLRSHLTTHSCGLPHTRLHLLLTWVTTTGTTASLTDIVLSTLDVLSTDQALDVRIKVRSLIKIIRAIAIKACKHVADTFLELEASHFTFFSRAIVRSKLWTLLRGWHLSLITSRINDGNVAKDFLETHIGLLELIFIN